MVALRLAKMALRRTGAGTIPCPGHRAIVGQGLETAPRQAVEEARWRRPWAGLVASVRSSRA